MLKITIPKQFRGNLEKKLVLTRGLDRSLSLYSKPIWEEMVLPLLEKKKEEDRYAYRFLSLMKSGAIEINMSKNGQISIPKFMVDYAYLQDKEDILILEIGSKVEIWSATRFSKKHRKVAERIEK